MHEPVIIQNIEIPSYEKLRSRRLKEVDSTRCGFNGCEEVAVGKGFHCNHKDREFLLCEKHLAEAESKPREWKVI